MTQLAHPHQVIEASLATLVASASDFAKSAKSHATHRAYRSDWAAFSAFCQASSLPSLPTRPETVALYITHLAHQPRKVSTISRALVAISQAHKMASFESPTAAALVRETLKGIRRALGVAPAQKSPVLVSDLRAMIAALPDSLIGTRNRALLCLGFAGAFRRSELVALTIGELQFDSDGLVVTLRKSKSDQEAKGRKVGIPYGGNPSTCPIRSVQAWLKTAAITDGFVFRRINRYGRIGVALSDDAVAVIVKRAAEAAGLDPRRYAGHSLRAGLATAAAKAGKSERTIMLQTGHRSVEMVRRYIRDGELFVDNAAAGIGL